MKDKILFAQLFVLFILSLPTFVLGQGSDHRRVDMMPIHGNHGLSLEQVRNSAFDSSCNCQRLKVTDIISRIRNGQTLDPQFGSSRTYNPNSNALLNITLSLSTDLGRFATGSLVMLDDLNKFRRDQQIRNQTINQWSSQLENNLRQSQAYNQNLAEASRSMVSQMRAQNQKLKANSSEYLATMAHALTSNSSISAQDLRRLQDTKRLAQDPFTRKDYYLSDEAAKNTIDELDRALAEKDYETAIDLKESLDYNVQRHALLQNTAAAFNSDGIIIPERVDSSLPVSPLSEFQLSSPTGHARQLVQRTANQFQNVWAQSRGLQSWSATDSFYYYSGLAALRDADQLFDIDHSEGLASLYFSRLMLDAATGFVHGFANGVQDLAVGLKEASKFSLEMLILYQTDKAKFLEKTIEVVHQLPDVTRAIIAEFKTQWEIVKSGSAYDRSVLAGRASVEIVTLLATRGTGQVASNIKHTDRLTGHLLRASDKKVIEALEKAEKLPPLLGRTVADSRLPLNRRVEALAFHEKLASSPTEKVRLLADKMAADSAVDPKLFGLDKEKLNRFTVHNVYTGDDVNRFFELDRGWGPPFPLKSVLEVSVDKEMWGFHLFDKGTDLGKKANQMGDFWIMRASLSSDVTIESLTKHLKLRAAVPGHRELDLAIVKLSPGTRMLRGQAASLDSLPGGGIQYYIHQSLIKPDFKPMTPELLEKMKRNGKNGL